jgi:hypothetical protein
VWLNGVPGAIGPGRGSRARANSLDKSEIAPEEHLKLLPRDGHIPRLGPGCVHTCIGMRRKCPGRAGGMVSTLYPGWGALYPEWGTLCPEWGTSHGP